MHPSFWHAFEEKLAAQLSGGGGLLKGVRSGIPGTRSSLGKAPMVKPAANVSVAAKANPNPLPTPVPMQASQNLAARAGAGRAAAKAVPKVSVQHGPGVSTMAV